MSRHCRFCHTPLTHTFADLGLSPLSNSYVKAERLNQGEMFYPLHAWCAPAANWCNWKNSSAQKIFSTTNTPIFPRTPAAGWRTPS